MPRSRLAVKAGQLVILDEARVRDLDDQCKEVLAHSLPTTGDVSGRYEPHSDIVAGSDDDFLANENPLFPRGWTHPVALSRVPT